MFEHEGLSKEFEFVTKESEIKHIGDSIQNTSIKMQTIAFALIQGDQDTVGELTKECLEEGISANEILDNGLLNGMAIVGVKFRDNIIFVPESIGKKLYWKGQAMLARSLLMTILLLPTL